MSEPYRILPLDPAEAQRRKEWVDGQLEETRTRWEALHAHMEASMEANKENLGTLKVWREEQPWGELKCEEKRTQLCGFFAVREEKVKVLKETLYDPATVSASTWPTTHSVSTPRKAAAVG